MKNKYGSWDLQITSSYPLYSRYQCLRYQSSTIFIFLKGKKLDHDSDVYKYFSIYKALQWLTIYYYFDGKVSMTFGDFMCILIKKCFWDPNCMSVLLILLFWRIRSEIRHMNCIIRMHFLKWRMVKGANRPAV